jgi:MoaA/NifB/PqqE/SkfB family radical SAM enzyme/SAM-dependent methyltransferase
VLPDLKVNGRPGNLSTDSLDDLWNAAELVQVRAAMARGEKPASCSACWKHEANGGVSRRMLINPVYRALGGELAVEKLAHEGAATGYRLERKPDWFVFELGNVCNLTCRSCNPLSSSRVAADRVAVAWNGTSAAVSNAGGAWFKQIGRLADTIADAGHERAMLSLMGGEPFLIEQTWLLLEELVARGLASTLYVGLSTNGQQRSARLEALAPHYRGFNVSVSVDAYGKLNEYLRYGSAWPKLVETIDWLRSIPKVDVAIVPTLQNCNVLDMPALLRFADARDLPVGYNTLSEPARLRPVNLPPLVRRVAARRLRTFLDAECKPVNRGVVRAYCEILEDAGDAFDADLFREFATFTNDLDDDRGQCLRDAAPDLVALIGAAGESWPNDRRHVDGTRVRSSFDAADLLERANRTVSPHDVIFTAGNAVREGWYFPSGAAQLVEIDRQLREHGHPGLAGTRAVADVASHYGRITRMLRAAVPHAAVYACDIDEGAVRFCADELGALPVVTGWRPDEDNLPRDLDAVTCISLLTHTTLEHWRRTLRAWAGMLGPGGVAAFTYLSEAQLTPWRAGSMQHYGTYSPELCAATEDTLRDQGFAFAPLTTMYGGEPSYGIAFATADVVRRELAAAGLDVIAMPGDAGGQFAQELVLARKPDVAAPAPLPAVARAISVVALYDPRCYAPSHPEEGDPADSVWSRLTAADTALAAPLPTELGFGDPRVAEVREAQAALAAQHGIDAFCYRFVWGAAGPQWDAPLRDLVASGRPDFPFCIMLEVETGTHMDEGAAAAFFASIADALADRRYVRVDGTPIVIVRDLAALQHARIVAAAWRAAAERHGLGRLHLCALPPQEAVSPQDMGFDSFLDAPADGVAAIASLVEPGPAHRVFRCVMCRRTPERRDDDLYEINLAAAIDATRLRGEKLVFVDAWNDWTSSAYLEPDDRDGRAALLATRRAARGPSGGTALLHRLRGALGNVEPAAASVLKEFEAVVSVHDRAADRLAAALEDALARERSHSEPAPARTEHTGAVRHANLESIAGVDGAALATAPIVVRGDELPVSGWSHVAGYATGAVEVFLALEPPDAVNDRLFRIGTRVERPDVVATFGDYPPNCGFEGVADIRDLPAGTYRVAIVQRTPDARYRDETAAVLVREETRCSTA